MKFKIKHPSESRIWPADYLPVPNGPMHYICPLDPVIETQSGTTVPNTCPWELSQSGIIMTAPQHDPVYLVLRDLHYADLDLSTIAGKKKYEEILALVALHDVRGYLSGQLGSITHTLKAAASLEDWTRHAERLDELERISKELQEEIEDADLAETRARQHDGYRKLDAAGEALLKKVLG